MTGRAERGRRAEQLALRWLRRHGLRLVERNFRCRWGELDLIMLDGDTLVVVEVRSRRDERFVSAASSIDWRKQSKIVSSTECFLSGHPEFAGHPVRFDVIAATGADRQRVQWLTDAFGPDEGP